MLAPVEAIQSDPDFQDAHASGKMIPNPAVYSDWFHDADEPRRHLAVGARRYATVEKLLGDRPEWWNFLDDRTGTLMTLDALRREDEFERDRRIARVQLLLNRRRREIGQVATFGFRPQARSSPSPLAAV